MPETFDDPTYELGAEYGNRETVWQYVHPACHPETAMLASPVWIRFEGKKGELPTKLRVECAQCGDHVVTLPLAQDGREALVLGKPREE